MTMEYKTQARAIRFGRGRWHAIGVPARNAATVARAERILDNFKIRRAAELEGRMAVRYEPVADWLEDITDRAARDFGLQYPILKMFRECRHGEPDGFADMRCGGWSHPLDEYAPRVFIKSGYSDRDAVFVLLHELCHLIEGRDGLAPDEGRCDRFADEHLHHYYAE